MASGIYRADGTFQPFHAAELQTELATRQNAGLALGDLEGWLNVLPDPDPVLRKRGDEASVLADLSADDQVTTAMLSRKNRVLNCPHFTFRAGAPEGETATPEAVALHRRFTQDIERANLRTIISSILDAPFYGFAPLELIWRREENWWHLVDVVARPSHWFGFDKRNNPVFVGAYGLACPEQRLLPAGKFVIVQHHASYDNPYGLRLLSRCLWPVAFKRGGLQFYARFVERHGMPWVVGEAPSQASAPEKRTMARDLARMVQDAVAVIPHGASVKLESARQTQGALHEAYLSRQDRAISKILMGQPLTVEREGKNSQAAAETHKDVADDLADADKSMVADAWNEIAWLYAQANAGPGVLAPLAAYEEPEDLNTRADLDKKLTEIGVQFTAEHFTENYGLKESEFTIRSIPSSGGPDTGQAKPAPSAVGLSGATAPTASPKDFAAPDPENAPTLAEKAQRHLDAAIKTMLPDALKASREFVTEVENAVKDAKNFDDLQDALVELLAPSMTPDALEGFLARAMTAAAGHGAASVQAEVEEDE